MLVYVQQFAKSLCEDCSIAHQLVNNCFIMLQFSHIIGDIVAYLNRSVLVRDYTILVTLTLLQLLSKPFTVRHSRLLLFA